MSPERARELLGGLATGILTPEERQSLFEAALHDQTLFNEVADELEFGAFLQSAETRAQLANRIETEPPRRQWWALRPRWLALSGVMAASVVVFVAVWQQHRPNEVVNDTRVATAEPAPRPASPPAAAQPPQPQSAQREAEVRQPVIVEKPKVAENKTAAPEDQSANFSKDTKAPVEIAKRREEKRTDEPAAPAPAPPPAQGMVAGGSVSTGLPPTSPQAPRPMEARSRDAAAAPPATLASPVAPRSAPGRGTGAFAPAASGATASIAGTVRDASGAPVPNAVIQIVNTATKETTQTTSNLSGYFGAAALPAGGPYTVIAQASGFKKEEKAGITLATNTPTQVDIPLQVGSMANTVEVTASAGLAVLDRAQAKPGINGQQIAVLNFANGPSQNQSGLRVADQLSSQLQNSGQNVIDRGAVQQAQQQSASQTAPSQVPTNKQAADLGRQLGADAVIVGSVQEDSQVAIKAKVIDTRKARPLANVAASGTSLQGATNQIGLKLASQLNEPVEGTVSKLDAGLIAITLKPPGLARIGARLEVFHGKQKIGELVLTVANGRSAAGKYSGTIPPRPGDRVASPH